MTSTPVAPSAPLRGPDDVVERVAAAVRFTPPGAVGVELEWHAVDVARPLRRPSLARVGAALSGLGPLPGGSLLSTEPGGQVELSSLPWPGPAAAVTALRADVDAVAGALDRDRIALRGLGADPLRLPERLVRTSRYDVMEAHFARGGSRAGAAGRTMMCSTAAVQVSVNAGLPGCGAQSLDERWRRAHAVGPALVAAFACSPLLRGAPTGWRSTRQRCWVELDPSRTAAPPPHDDAVAAFARLALDALVLAVRDADGACRPAPPGLTFRAWLAAGDPDRPTVADLDYHLTTLFPPVRLRGHVELRYMDALPDPLWEVAVATAAAVLDDDRAADEARAACAPVESRWLDAARLATADPALARAATGCLTAAAGAMGRLGQPALAAAVESYCERYAARGRCPADDLLDAHAAGHSAADLLLEWQAVPA